MKKRTLFIVMTFIFTIGILLVGCGNAETNGDSSGNETDNGEAAPSEKIKLNIGHSNSTDNHYHAFATKFAEIVSEKSDESIEVNVFPQSQLGGEVEMFQGAREGSIDMFIAGQSALTNVVKELAIFDLPYLFDSYEQANEILAGDLGQKYLDILSEHNVKGLGYLSVIERNVFSSKPINQLNDMKGFKIRTAQAPAYMKAYESLGAQPTPMAFDEVYLSLQQGVVDGGEGSPDNYVQEKFHEVANYYNLTKIHYLPTVVAISGATWEKLTPDQQEIIQESVKEALPESLNNYANIYNESLEKAVEDGVEVIEPDLAEFREAMNPVYNNLLNDIPNGQELFEELQAATTQ